MSHWLDLGRKQAAVFTDNNLGYVESLITCVVPKKIMIMCYYILLRQKALIKIEDLPLDQKTTLWETSKYFDKGRLNKDQIVELAKCLYTVEYFLNN